MERTTSKERKNNARLFYQYLWNGVQKAAIVIKSQESKTNPNIHRVQFVTSHVNGPASKVVIAESVDGITGCFHELIESIHGNIPQKGYYEDDFKIWLRKVCHMDMIWNDGLVIMLEYRW